MSRGRGTYVPWLLLLLGVCDVEDHVTLDQQTLGISLQCGSVVW